MTWTFPHHFGRPQRAVFLEGPTPLSWGTSILTAADEDERGLTPSIRHHLLATHSLPVLHMTNIVGSLKFVSSSVGDANLYSDKACPVLWHLLLRKTCIFPFDDNSKSLKFSPNDRKTCIFPFNSISYLMRCLIDQKSEAKSARLFCDEWANSINCLNVVE
jgi:hypothetical protein